MDGTVSILGSICNFGGIVGFVCDGVNFEVCANM